MLPTVCERARTARRPQWASLFSLFLLFLMSSNATTALVRPYTVPGNLLQYFQVKYPQVDESIEVRIQPTADGPLGQLDLTGALEMSVDVTGLSTEDAARAVATAFLTAEADLLDIPNLSDMHETSLVVDTENGFTVVQYARYVGALQFVDVNIRIVVNDDNAITHVEATLAPASAAMTAAVGQTTITSSDASTIVRNDLVHSNQPIEPTLSQPALIATWRPPYVVWGVSGSVGDKPAWGYSLDAFTGEILNKSCTALMVREASGGTPCD